MSKGNRQKAGVKSASSHMAAELLSGGGMVTFDTFSGGCASMIETEDTISLKKLGKRDSSTREKALREMLERCTAENMDTVVYTFSNFSAQFDKIIFDCSPTVRQLAIKLISKQVDVLKKKAEKELFSILPSIIFASCDPFTPCSNEATNFLHRMFTKEKLDEILKKVRDKVLKILEEILVSGESTLLIPSKLMKNDEEDSREERMDRLSEQSYGVLINYLKGEKKEEAETILLHRLKNVKKNEITRGLLNTIIHCIDPVSIMCCCSFFDRLMSIFSSNDQCSLLPLTTDLLLLYMSSTSYPLNEKEKKKVVNAILHFIKKCGVAEWDSLGIRLLPLFSSLCSTVDVSSRAPFISNWFDALKSNGIPTKESILYIGDCIKCVLALLDSPTVDETGTALSMMLYMISQSSSCDPSSLQSLIIWTIPRLSETKVRFFLEEVLRICKEKLPSSRSLLESLLSLHCDHLIFGWEYLHQNGMESLPIHLLTNAPDCQLVCIHSSIDLLTLIEESGDSSLSILYSRLSSLLPSSSFKRDKPVVYSPLISSVLTITDDESFNRILLHLSNEDRLKCVEEWTKKEDIQSTIKMVVCLGKEEKTEIENALLSFDSTIQFMAGLTQSSQFSRELCDEVAVRAIKGYVSQSLKETKPVYLTRCTLSVIRQLDVPFILNLITHQVMKSSTPLQVPSFHSMATLFFDFLENGMNLLDESFFFTHILSIISSLVDELTHYALLSHYWPCEVDKLPYRAKSCSNLVKQVDEINKALALFLSLYVYRGSDCPTSLLLLPIIIFSSVIRLSRSSSLSLLSQSETENELLEYAQQMIESGSESIDGDVIVSLLSHSSSISRPLLIHSLRSLSRHLRNGIIPSQTNTPFSALPTNGFNLHLEMARQLYYGRNMDAVLETIFSYSQSEERKWNEELFTVQCDDDHFSLSISTLTGANEYLKKEREGEANGGENGGLSDSILDFLRCAIATSLNSIHSHSQYGEKEGRMRLLTAASIQLAIFMNETKAEEWVHFFLPSITPIVLKMYGETDMMENSCLTRIVNMFVITHPSLEWDRSWNDHWEKKSLRYHMEMDEAGIHSAIQTMVVKASNILKKGEEDRGEAIVAASRIIGMCASHTISYKDEEKEMSVILPPFMKNLAAKDGWSRCGVLIACLSIVEREDKEENIGERSVICDAMAPVITKCLTTIVSKCEADSHLIPSRYFIEKAIPSRGYFVHWLSYLLRDTFASFPSIVKMWYTGLPKAASTLVNEFISSRLSSILIDHEITQVMDGNLPEKYKNDQATLTIRRHANEILLDYILEDTRMRLMIKLPIGWPLVPPCVSVEGSIVGVEDGRKWMLQLNSQLHRNASLVSGISAWLIHAGKKVEGTESCTICMQLVAPQTKQLPKARCRTCHNKFHSSCLYKWFESSNQSSCPLCRTDFTAPP